MLRVRFIAKTRAEIVANFRWDKCAFADGRIDVIRCLAWNLRISLRISVPSYFHADALREHLNVLR